MRRSIPLGIVLAVVVSAGRPAAARSLESQLSGASQLVGISSGSAFDALAQNIADASARALPIISSSAGFTYRYNPTLEVFERTSETLGPLYLERPDTLGKGKFNVSVSFQYVQFDAFDGTNLTKLQNKDPILVNSFDANGNPIGTRPVRLRYSLGIQNYVTAVSATYGITDDLDVNLLLPIVSTSLRVGVYSQPVTTTGANAGPLAIGRDDGSAAGVGDILLRGKYQLPRLGWLRSALGLQLGLPSGRMSDFQGTGDVEVSPFLYLSTVLWDRVEPHANLGIDYDASNLSQSAARYGLGVDVDVTKIFNVNVAYLGRSAFEPSASKQSTEFLHLHNGQSELEPLLGLDFGRKDTSDLSFGFRVVVWGNLMVYANGIYAINDSGLRNNTIIPAGGIEGTF
jgi:hypothetical protein